MIFKSAQLNRKVRKATRSSAHSSVLVATRNKLIKWKEKLLIWRSKACNWVSLDRRWNWKLLSNLITRGNPITQVILLSASPLQVLAKLGLENIKLTSLVSLRCAADGQRWNRLLGLMLSRRNRSLKSTKLNLRKGHRLSRTRWCWALTSSSSLSDKWIRLLAEVSTGSQVLMN